MDDLAALARRVLGAREISSIRPLGDGGDHVAIEVNGVFVVRQRKALDADTAALVEREVRLLDIVRRVSPIAVPEVVTAEPSLGIIVLRKLPGTPLFDEPCDDPRVLVEPLAGFLSAIHDIPQELVEPIVGTDPYGMDELLVDAVADMSTLAEVLSRDDRHMVEAFLATPPPSEPAVTMFCHNDLGAEHLLASPDRTTLTGVIDWSDAAVTDPARDLGRPYRDLGPDVAASIVERLGSAGDERFFARVAFYARCALLEDLTYGLAPGRRRYADRALAHLRRTFGA